MSANLSCPSCGAPARSGPESATCDYCGSALATVACPSCFGAMFAGMQFCPHCGARGTREFDDQNASGLACPGCEMTMHVVRIGTASLHECPECTSNWVDTETFTAMCTNREQRGAVAAIVGKSTGRPVGSMSGEIRYRPCPLCKKLMNRTNFGQRSGVIIDVCKGHGAWFEPMELHRVLSFVDSGGFDRAKSDEAKRMAEEQRLLKRTLMPHSAPLHVSINDRQDDGDSMLERALYKLLF